MKTFFGRKELKDRGKQAAFKEMKQLHDRVCFEPIDKKTLAATEAKRVLESLIFLAEKKVDQSVKARTCANGKPQRQWSDKEEKSSPTVSIASVFLTSMIEAKENRDVATVDVPNAFIQTDQPNGFGS